ncbi:DUF4235 domain-containing protein [Streptomyces fulvorobeus]|uniref:Membrane protein n=1 Tax=Streptomyces fulvorobeus TaxID=284028 RepID=A0A7J0BZY9_9ACTN|nr:DUF4235 domain-containing protein [Streptomyces fulvorobeus]NYE39503.1 putative metal-dependent enzyme (double-stranded beta helix superfamily) [Streptomyces fulvorobeus]GFM95738.1 membrane protein [Streptomyces fulvorobeus]
MNVAKAAYKPVGLVFGSVSGLVAGALFKSVWKHVKSEEDAPDATDEHRQWREILLAAAVQGAIFAAVKALADRGGATVIRRLTGAWPG